MGGKPIGVVLICIGHYHYHCQLVGLAETSQQWQSTSSPMNNFHLAIYPSPDHYYVINHNIFDIWPVLQSSQPPNILHIPYLNHLHQLITLITCVCVYIYIYIYNTPWLPTQLTVELLDLAKVSNYLHNISS